MCSWKTAAAKLCASHWRFDDLLWNRDRLFQITWMAGAIRRGSKRRRLVLDGHQELQASNRAADWARCQLWITAIFTHLKQTLHLLHSTWHHTAHKAALTDPINGVWATFTLCNTRNKRYSVIKELLQSYYCWIITENMETSVHWRLQRVRYYNTSILQYWTAPEHKSS